MKSALFVDFDNVYSGLRKLDQTIADRFAHQPLQWMNWVVDALELPDHTPTGARRRVLVRRCYLNPQAYQRFRPSFNVAGFQIIDCPALTSEGKTSTDIHMVLDIVDLLQHEVHYDEFIVFSADADFTPVLRKLRRWDRRTTVLAIGFPSAAYRASADLLIDQDDFVRHALGFKDDDESLPPEPAATSTTRKPDDRALAAAARTLVEQTVAESKTPVGMAKLAAKLLSTVDGMDASTWAGHGSFRALLASWNLAPMTISTAGGGTVYDPRRHAAPELATTPPTVSIDSELARIAKLIRQEVGRSNAPVPCSRMASLITTHHGAIAADWNGKGTFRKFLETLSLGTLQVDWRAGGGSILDPARPIPAPATDSKAFNGSLPHWESDQDLLPIATRIHEVSGIPLLGPIDYQALFRSIALDVAKHPFDLNETGKRVRDLVREAGHGGSRLDVNWILRGLLLHGHVFGRGQDDSQSLARMTANNVRSLCLREQMFLDMATDAAIKRWLEGPQ
ncbi:MAG: NYN domain-containing protein [Candidatus Accumulibacter sp.]|uniref:NYN domain-containing protein n=1 Tax=Accumulibacter sp. TaxID=2053492 RepID=UPI0025F10A4C|nr:NYN domain-containing protein [Accumulibacter sp.]MCP5250076.1 NYN domain-containing protein [Accumulibacter sp.]